MTTALDDPRRLLAGAQRVVSFSGAGLSAESGVPTFRDAATRGHWRTHDPMRLASPEGFAADPELVLAWYGARRVDIARSQPNAAHRALAVRREIVHITQNVDDLLERAGAEGVIHLHGSIGEDRCHRACGFLECIELAMPPSRRDCPRCSAPVRPNVVWFGELLPAEAWQAAEEAIAGCDVLLVVGTSAVVYPAAGLISFARSAGASIIIVNTESSDASELAHVELLGRAGALLPELLEA